MSESTTGTDVAKINAANDAERLATVATQKVAPAKAAPAKRSTSRASRGAAQSAKTAPAKGRALKSVPAPKAAAPVKIAKPKVAKDTGPTQTAVKRAAACLAVDALGSAFGKLTDAQLKKAGLSADDRELVGLVFASALNYIPVPADYWHPALPDRSFAGGRGSKGRRATA